MLNLNTFNDILLFIQGQGYLFVFLIMIIEGPVITTAAAFAASLGYFNVWIIFLLAILGDLVGDLAHYAIGYFGRKKVIDRYSKKEGFIVRIDRHFEEHLGKTLFVAKMTPLATPGLLLAGASKVNLKKYTIICLLIILPRAIFFTVAGYFFGTLTGVLFAKYKNIEYILLALVISLILVYWLGKIIFKKFSTNLNKVAKKIIKKN